MRHVQHSRTDVRRAFTLPELLIVIGIIAVLIGIIFPALGRVREHSRQMVCLTNLRQLSTAVGAYALANDGAFPVSAAAEALNGGLNYADWLYWQPGRKLGNSALARYLGLPASEQALHCPSDDGDRPPSPKGPEGTYQWGPSAFRFSYCMNRSTASGSQYASQRITRVRSPATAIIFAEVDDRWLNDAAWEPTFYSVSGETKGKTIWLELVSNRHDPRPRNEMWYPYYLPDEAHPDSRGNVGYLDGHAAFVTRREAHDPKASRQGWDN